MHTARDEPWTDDPGLLSSTDVGRAGAGVNVRELTPMTFRREKSPPDGRQEFEEDEGEMRTSRCKRARLVPPWQTGAG